MRLSVMRRWALVVCLLLPWLALAHNHDELDARVREAVRELHQTSPTARELSAKARGMLVFPRVFKAGYGIGGEFGEGVLLADGRTVDYYNIASASVGLQLGIQRKSVVVLFMTDEALRRFRESEGWKVGVDTSIAIVTVGIGGEIDTDTLQKPVIGFLFSNKGLMYNLTLEGSKISRVAR
jgi:lipid-binding SYLF domain-containing protein